uniref:hypothetical protein n=1 Tax=Okeania sp. SIO2F4 TaxID=2607790 RepID=UPI0025D9A915|nr:hypothetical protein [Okeania sp. SIO2F4]
MSREIICTHRWQMSSACLVFKKVYAKVDKNYTSQECPNTKVADIRKDTLHKRAYLLSQKPRHYSNRRPKSIRNDGKS